MAAKSFFSIAGYDPSSGAGVTADVKTAAAHNCYALTCITALTVQTTQQVYAVEPIRPEIVSDTLFELAADTPPDAVRIGMLGSAEVAEAVAAFLEAVRPPNVVLDPVLVSSSGKSLLDPRGQEVLRSRLLPLADVITPNLAEAYALSGIAAPPRRTTTEATMDAMREAALRLHTLGSRNVVVTGGDNDLEEALDLLSMAGVSATREEWLRAPKVHSKSTHGTGCAFASAIACNLAWGMDLTAAVRAAKEYVREAMLRAIPIGRGRGPLNHLFRD